MWEKYVGNVCGKKLDVFLTGVSGWTGSNGIFQFLSDVRAEIANAVQGFPRSGR